MYSGIIYKYTSPSNKVYIGLTINEEIRKKSFYNINHMYAGGKIDKARAKYSPSSFSYEVLERIENEDKKELLNMLNELEVKYISLYDSYKNGYNSSPGGLFIYIYSPEAKERISSSLSKRIIQYDLYGNYLRTWNSALQASSELGINRSGISKCCAGKSSHSGIYIWKYYRDDFPLNINGLPQNKINSILRSKDSLNTISGNTFKKVLLYDLDGNFLLIFESLKAAAASVGLSSTVCITLSCKNLGASKGFLWRYYVDNYPTKIVPNLSKHSLIVANKHNFKIYQYTTSGQLLKIWKSYKEITDTLNICRTGVYQCCTNKLKTYKNFIWSYVELDK